MEPPPDRVRRPTQYVRRLVLRVPFQAAEDERQAVGLAQSLQLLVQGLEQFPNCQLIERITRHRFSGLSTSRLVVLAALLSLAMLEGQAMGDTMQPRGQRTRRTDIGGPAG